MAEHQPSKLRVAGSIPVSRSIVIDDISDLSFNHSASLSLNSRRVFSLLLAHVAQPVEHFLGKEEVIGSNPIVGSKESRDSRIFL